MFLTRYLLAKLKSESGQALATAESDQSGVKDASSQADQATKLEGLISDIDLSDVPEDIRGDVKKHLSEKVKLYDTGYRAKTEDFSRERKTFEESKKQVEDLMKLREEIQGNPLLEKEITRVINQARAGNLGVQQQSTDRKLKEIDKLLDQAPDADTRETLRQLKTIVEESVPGEDVINQAVEKALAPFKQQIETLQKANKNSHSGKVDELLNKLGDEYGEDIVKKYSNDVRTVALNQGTSDMKGIRGLLAYYAAGDEGFEAAILNKAQRKKEIEEKRKMEGSSAGTNGVSVPIEPVKDKNGRIDIRDLVGKMLK